MHNAVETMLNKYQCVTGADYLNALKEIFQEIALLGLWRAKFFEHAAFYGGTALRILYRLDRFSEDMDFSLLKPNNDFELDKYNAAIAAELNAFGFHVEVIPKLKNHDTSIESAFIKANTIKQLLAIEVPKHIISPIHDMHIIKIKMEVDTNPPGHFSTEAKSLLLPIPFSALTFVPSDLFAGKLHALLCRAWTNRIKGRDWYDYAWYVSRDIPVHIQHLETRLRQSNHWREQEPLNATTLKQLLSNKINSIDFNAAKKDVINFIKDKSAVNIWSADFFHEITRQLKCI